ncbi:MAG: universal stress protein [Gammaproteobacteria bacterium]
MTIKDILVHVDRRATCAERLAAAVELARRFDAHLTGLYVIPRLDLFIFAEMPVPPEILAEQEAELRKEAAQAEAEFKRITAQAGCAATWRCLEGDAVNHINAEARHTDLIVLSKAEAAGMLSRDALIHYEIIISAGRPVLFIPYSGIGASICKRVLVAWNGSREAVRAVNDAIPVLAQADKVEVLAVNPPSAEGDIPSAAICLHLARHGVKAEASETVAEDVDVGALVLARVADHGFDLIVMGAYGHTRLRETILGGVTHHLLRHMPVPVLMSH